MPPRLAAAARVLAAALIGLALVAGLCGDELGRFQSAIPGYDNTDHAGAVYLHQQFHERIFAGSLPGFDPNQLYPTGTWLAGLHGGNSLEMLASLALRVFLPWPAWFSWAHFIWIPLNLIAFLPLGRHLWGRTAPALAAGAAWSILPLHLGEIYAGRMTQVALVGLPIAVLGLLRVAEEGGRRPAMIAGAGLALTGVGYWFYGLFMGLLLPIFAAWGAWSRREDRRALAQDLAIACVAAGLLAAPLLLPVLGPRLLGQWTPSPPIDPANANPVFDNALQLVGEQPIQLQGWLPWILIPGWVVTLWRGQRRPLWLALGLFCLMCAAGPAQRLGDRVWHLPYELLWRGVPFLDRLTHPSRWLGVGGIFLVIGAVDGIARLPRSRPSLGGWASWMVPAGVMAHLYGIGLAPPGHWRQELPTVWAEVASEIEGAVIVVPVLNAPHTCRWQPVHGRPLLGGMVEHLPWAWPPEFREMVESNAMLMGMYALGWNKDQAPPVFQQDLDALRGLGFEAVVLDREAWRFLPIPTSLDPERRLRQSLGEPIFSDESGVLWRLPESGREGPPPAPVMALPPP